MVVRGALSLIVAAGIAPFQTASLWAQQPVEAQGHSDKKIVTAAMREVKFIAPVFVGDLVSFYTETVNMGNTSMTVRITVEAKRATAPHEVVRVTQAEVVYVAVDDTGQPVPARPFKPVQLLLRWSMSGFFFISSSTSAKPV